MFGVMKPVYLLFKFGHGRNKLQVLNSMHSQENFGPFNSDSLYSKRIELYMWMLLIKVEKFYTILWNDPF